jgi:hypothetical protein
MAAGDTTLDTSAMTAATNRIWFRPVVKAARVIIPTAGLACSGSRAITFPDLPGLHRRGDLRATAGQPGHRGHPGEHLRPR